MYYTKILRYLTYQIPLHATLPTCISLKMYTCHSLRCRMDLQLVALRIELDAQLTLNIKLPWGKCFTVTIIDKLLWSYQSPAIYREIFNINDAEPDNTPPDFSVYSKAVSLYLQLCTMTQNIIALHSRPIAQFWHCENDQFVRVILQISC